MVKHYLKRYKKKDKLKQVSLKALREFFDSLTLEELNGIELSTGGDLIDPSKFIKTHFSYLESNPKNKGYYSYYERLLDIYYTWKNKEK